MCFRAQECGGHDGTSGVTTDEVMQDFVKPLLGDGYSAIVHGPYWTIFKDCKHAIGYGCRTPP